jgi:hypothetical protein
MVALASGAVCWVVKRRADVDVQRPRDVHVALSGHEAHGRAASARPERARCRTCVVLEERLNARHVDVVPA